MREFYTYQRFTDGRRGKRPQSGQTMIFLLMVMLVLFFVALWHFDLHRILHVKNLAQNAGDAAALAAARWQGRTLNMIGDLNIVQAMALMSGEPETASSVSEIQARLCFIGPIIGAMAAQQAAKHNRIHVNEQFTGILRRHASTVRNVYPFSFSTDGTMLFPEPFENAWAEYAGMIDMLCDHGIAAAPDNMRLYQDYAGGHILLHPDFYDAVNGRNWCWFYLNRPGLLDDYSGFRWWPPLPPVLPTAHPVNSEIFGLGLERLEVLDRLEAIGAMDDFRISRGLGETVIDEEVMEYEAAWYVYDARIWSAWSALSYAGGFPVVGPVHPEYDVAGADVAVRVIATAERLPPGEGSDRITWTAAAKPFGTLDGGRVNEYGIVLPAFNEVRLIPMDASSAPAGGHFDLEWREHIENHLPDYMEEGTSALSGACRYCDALRTWEDPDFRRQGSEWLEEYSHTCYTIGGPGGPGGGTRRAH